MNSKRLWATTAAFFALSAFGPHSFRVRAQSEMAVCSPGWEWVRRDSELLPPSHLSPPRKGLVVIFLVGAHVRIVYLCRTRTRLGKIHVRLVP